MADVQGRILPELYDGYGLPTSLPGVGTYVGGIEAVADYGNGNYFAVDGSLNLAAPGRAVRPMAKVIEVKPGEERQLRHAERHLHHPALATGRGLLAKPRTTVLPIERVAASYRCRLKNQLMFHADSQGVRLFARSCNTLPCPRVHRESQPRRIPMQKDETKGPKRSEADRKAERKDKEERLEEGLEESFPASDPVSVSQPTRTGEPAENRKPDESATAGRGERPRRRSRSSAAVPHADVVLDVGDAQHLVGPVFRKPLLELLEDEAVQRHLAVA